MVACENDEQQFRVGEVAEFVLLAVNAGEVEAGGLLADLQLVEALGSGDGRPQGCQ
jgi:hypothetical protein